MENIQKKEFSLKDFTDILIPKIWIVILSAVILAAGAFTFSFTREDKYTSSVQFFVAMDASSTINPYYETTVIKNSLNKYESQFSSNDFYDEVINQLDLDMTRKQLKEIYKITINPEEQLFAFTVTHGDKQLAYKIADYVYDAIKVQVDLDAAENKTVKPTLIEINKPELAETRDGKNSVRNSLIAFLIGAVLSSAVIIIIAISDVTIRDKKKIEDNFNIPILGIIPSQDFGGQNP